MPYYNSERRAQAKSKPQYRKVAIKDAGIDHQIICLHKAMADKCFLNPTLFIDIEARVEMRYAAKQMSYGTYLTWLSILELQDKPALFEKALLEKSVKMRNLRRATVFTQVLTEEERVVVIDSLHNS